MVTFDAAVLWPLEVPQPGLRAHWHHVVMAKLATGEAGQDVVEYGLLIATIAVVVLIGITLFGAQIEPWFAQLAGRITTTGT